MMNLGNDSKSVFLSNVLSFWTNDVTIFSTVTGMISLSICHVRFLIFDLELEWQCSQHLELNPTCDIDLWVT